MKGTKDEHGNIIMETSLNYLIRRCSDFVNEKTMLQYMGEQLGVIVDRSPKCTPEIAGEGVEYDWAMAKLAYRKLPLEKKKGKEKFHKLVHECVGHDVLTVERTRQFARRRARLYMVSYYMLEKDEKTTTPLDVQHF